MADSKITALGNLTAADPVNDMFPIVDVNDFTMAASGTTKRISVNNLLSSSPTASGALTVTGLVTAGSATITGAATVGTTLGVTGVSTLASAVVTGALTSGTTTLVAHAAGYTGKVGIGTATPAEKLDIYSAAGTAAIKLQTAANIPFTLNSQIPGVSNDGFSIYDGTASANRLTIDSSGNVNVVGGNLVIGTSGKGIDFSATASGSGTMTSELLNDYEEGTWTPVATGLTNVGAVTYTATYTKIGRVVYINLKVSAVTSTTSVANTTYFSGLPFNPAQNSTVTAVNEGNITSLGVGLIATGSNLFAPSWTAVQNATLSGFYYV
jgi:hypothetical protein